MLGQFREKVSLRGYVRRNSWYSVVMEMRTAPASFDYLHESFPRHNLRPVPKESFFSDINSGRLNVHPRTVCTGNRGKALAVTEWTLNGRLWGVSAIDWNDYSQGSASERFYRVTQ